MYIYHIYLSIYLSIFLSIYQSICIIYTSTGLLWIRLRMRPRPQDSGSYTLCQHTSAYVSVSIRQHSSAYRMRPRQQDSGSYTLCASAGVSSIKALLRLY